MILYSVIIPHYNRPDKLKRLLDTIPNTPDIEVLVIDDISTKYKQEYLDIVANYSQSGRNIVFLENSEFNKSPGGARNVGIERAKGRWLLFADSDDIFLPGWLKSVDRYKDSENDIVYFSPRSGIDRNGIIDMEAGTDRHVWYADRVKDYISHPSTKTEWRLRTRFEVPWSKMIRRELLIKTGHRFNRQQTGEDYVFSSILALFVDKIEVCNEPIYCVTESGDSITNNFSNNLQAMQKKTQISVDKLFYRYLPWRIKIKAGFDPVTIFIWRPQLIKNSVVKWLSTKMGTRIQKVLQK